MAIRELKDQITRLPEQPGVYLYFNAAGETIYVGKARALRDRVRNYLGAYGSDPKTDALLDEISRLEFIVTDSVVEALALENNLIKQRSPKYNILLRDDKNYPYLQLTTNEAFPRVLVARRVERDGSFYAGPFLPARFARKTMALTHRLFGIRSCNEVITGKRDRPCLEYDIKRCIAPCVDTLCTAEEYGRAVDMTQMFFEGRNDELAKSLRTRMQDAAEHERFEEAAELRDAMRTVQTLGERQQKMATTELGNRDAFGLKIGVSGAVVQVFQVRGGRVVERVELGADTPIAGANESDVHRSGDRAVLRVANRSAGCVRAGTARRAGGARVVAVGTRRPKSPNRRAAARGKARARRSREPQRRTGLPATIQPGGRGSVRSAQHPAGSPRLANPPAPDRVLRYLDHSGQRDRRVDGRVRRRAHETIGLSEVQNQGSGIRG